MRRRRRGSTRRRLGRGRGDGQFPADALERGEERRRQRRGLGGPEPGGHRGEGVLVGDHGRSAGVPGEGEAEIAADELPDGRAVPERCCDLVAVAAEVQCPGEAPAHVVQPLDQPFCDLAFEEGLAVPVTRRAVAALAEHRAVEDQKGIRGRHSLYVR